MTSRQARSPAPRATRTAQRNRTRAAILAAASDLLRQGMSPSVDEIAAAAEVSQRTVYMHFPTLDQLLLDASVGLMSQTHVDAALGGGVEGDDAHTRVAALVDTLVRLAPEALPLGRQIIKLTVDRPDTADAPRARRGYRRVEWIQDALEPLREDLTDEAYQRLVAALSVLIGWESMIVLRDVIGLEPEREAEVMRWAAQALVSAAVADQKG